MTIRYGEAMYPSEVSPYYLDRTINHPSTLRYQQVSGGNRARISRRASTGVLTLIAETNPIPIGAGYYTFYPLPGSGSVDAPAIALASNEEILVSASPSYPLWRISRPNNGAIPPAKWSFVFVYGEETYDWENNYWCIWWGTGKTPNGSVSYAWPSRVTVTPLNQPPSGPIIQTPTGQGWTLNRRPKIKIEVSDQDGDPIRAIEVQIANDAGFTVNLQTFSFVGEWASSSIAELSPYLDLPLGTAYCRARAKDDSVWGNYSTTQTFVIRTEGEVWTFPTDSIDPAGAGVLLSWLTEARTAIEAAEQFRGITVASWTDPEPTADTDIRVVHVQELRDRLKVVLATVGVTTSWIDTITTDTVRKGQHWIELREYLKQT